MHIVCFSGITWEQRKLDDFGLATSGTSIESEFSSDGKYKVISIGSYSENSVYTDQGIRAIESEKTIKRVLNEDDLTMILNDKTTSGNIIGRVLRIEKGGIYVYNQRTQRIEPNKEKYDTQFLYQLLNAPLIREKIFKQSQGNTQIYVNWSAIKELDYLIPSLSEQKQIGVYFQNIDNLITLHQRKYDRLVNVKKSMLSKMFPKEGETVPEIRFKGFTGDWEQRKLRELGESFEYGLNAAAMEFDGENKYIRITDIEDSSRLFLDADLTSPNIDLSNADNFILKYGDILFARTGASVGKSYIYRDFDGLVFYAGFLIRARIKKEFDPEFVFYNTLTNEYNQYIRITSQRSGQPGVNAQEYAEYEIKVPNYEEQVKIGAFMRQLDNLITLHQRELDKLKNIKKACLEKMFI